MTWSWTFESYHDQIVAEGRQPVLLLLVGLVLGFGFIRTSTRLIRAQVRWWPGNVSAGGVHLHHEFFGVLLMLGAGGASFATPAVHPWEELLAVTFGIGAGLVLDEFALLLHLQDVYWAEQGRSSIDAVFVAVVLTLMLLVRAAPFGIADATQEEQTARWGVVGVVAVNLLFTVITAIKGKPWIALFSVFVTGLGLFGAFRLATPDSPWARRRYRGRKAERAARRAAPWIRRKQRLVTLIGGAATPTPTLPAPEHRPVSR